MGKRFCSKSSEIKNTFSILKSQRAMANQYVDLQEPLSQEEVPNRRLGKKHVFLGFLIGMACGCVWALSQDGQQTMDPTNAMAMNVKQVKSLPSQNFLRFKQPVQSQDKLDLKTESAIQKSMLIAGGLLSAPHAAHAAMTPSLQNLLNSVVAGGVVVGAIFAAVAAVSNFDPVDRA